MITKEEIIGLFQTHKEDFTKLKLRQREKDKISKSIHSYIIGEAEIETNITNDYSVNGDIRPKNLVSDKVGNVPIKKEKKLEELQERLKELDPIIEELEDRVEAVTIRLDVLSLKERKIIEAVYFDERTFDDIGNNLYWQLFKQTRTEKAIKNIIKKSINKMINL